MQKVFASDPVRHAVAIAVVATGTLLQLGCSGSDTQASGTTSSGVGGAATSTGSHTSASNTSTGGDGGASGTTSNSTSGGDGGSGGSACLSSDGGGGSSSGAGGGCNGPGGRYITRVVEACLGPDADPSSQHFPSVIYGPPKGGGEHQGSTDVLSLGNGGFIVVGFDNAIVDGPGPDFIVFENPFDVGDNPEAPYANPGTVAVSDDGQHWVSFPCTATHYPYGECAGWHPVFANPDTNSINPLDPKTAGGDAFDLADIGVARARFVRITDRPDLPGDFDLDAIGIVNAECP